MKEKVVRIRIHPHLFKRFQIICVEKDLSIPRQTTELVRKFVEVQEENDRLMKGWVNMKDKEDSNIDRNWFAKHGETLTVILSLLGGFG